MPICGPRSMKAQKRKSSTPEPRPMRSKALKRDETTCAPQISNGGPLCTLSVNRHISISTPAKGKGCGMTVTDGLSPMRHSPRFKQRTIASGQLKNGEDCQLSPSPSEAEEEDTELGLVITLDGEDCGGQRLSTRKSSSKLKSTLDNGQEEGHSVAGKRSSEDSSSDSEEDEFEQLDMDLERKSQQHNLTSVNVRTILHEVITNEHVVAMMKAAIQETQDLPLFEPKMTRSRLKEVVEKGVGIPTWNISPIKRALEVKPPQFVDIPLEEEEDSSDEEYCPDEDEEDETTEEMFWSDVDSTASSPRCARGARPRTPGHSECEEDRFDSPRQKPRQPRHLRVETVPMGPPPPPSSTGPSRPLRAQDCTFLEKLHAVEEELELSPICTESFQPLTGGAGSSLVACRTRSKRTLRNVPLGKLEAELHAPDITPDMYDYSLALEDRDWSEWLQGLMTSDMENEEEGDDDDDPEYNFLEDLDEPDREDYRNDRAVRITKKEVNELLEELFETFQDDELIVNGQDDDGHEEDEEREEAAPPPSAPQFNVPQAIRFQEPLANMLTERRRTVREQMEALQQRRALQETPGRSTPTVTVSPPMVLLPPLPCPVLTLDHTQKLQLQQQVQQHIQLLTQVHLLCSPVEALHHKAHTTKQYLEELQTFAQREEAIRSVRDPGFSSIFRACNLQGALSLVQEQESSVSPSAPSPPTPPARPQTRSNNVRTYPLLHAETAWLLATRSIFLYPELLPHCSLDPALHPPRTKNNFYTRGEDRLIVLGLKHFSQTELPYQLMCRYLIRTKKQDQLRSRVKELCGHKTSDNAIKLYCQHNIVPAMQETCGRVMPGEERPPVEREMSVMPNWLRKSLPFIHRAVMEYNKPHGKSPSRIPPPPPAPPYTFANGTRYPPSLPRNVILRLHPCMNYKGERPPIAPKPRPFYAFTHSAPLTPLAKALPDTLRFLAHVPGPIPSQGVILLAKAPSTPIRRALPLSQAPVTPAHGAVPLVQVLPSIPVGAPLFVMQTSPNQTEKKTPYRAPFRKLLPIQPATPNPSPPPPLFALPAENGGTPSLVTNSARRACAAPRLAKRPSRSTPSHQDTQAKTRAALARTLPRPLLPAPPSLEVSLNYPPTPPDSRLQLKSSPVFFSHTPSPPLSIKTSPMNPSLDNQNSTWGQPIHAEVKDEVGFDPSLTYSQNLSGYTPNITNTDTFTLQSSSSHAIMSPSIIQSLSAPKNDQYVLVQTATHGSMQMLWVPKHCLVSNGSVSSNASENGFHRSESLPFGLSPAPQHNITGLTNGIPSCISPLTTLPNGTMGYQQALSVRLPSNSVLTSGDASGSSLEEQLHRLVEGLREEGELEEKEGWGDVEGPLLTLSESPSGSPCSSLESHADALERMMVGEMEGGEDGVENNRIGGEEERREVGLERWCMAATSTHIPDIPPERNCGEEDERREEEEGDCGVHGMGMLSGRTVAQEQTGGGGGEKNGGEEGDQREGDSGRGGEEERNGEKGEDGKGSGEGEEEGERDGGQNGGGEKDGEKDGDGEQERQGEEEEEEDFDDLTQDEDEEEVMSSASEESVLSVPELQETMKKLTWLASERRLCDSEEDNSPNSPTSPNSPVSQNSQEENSEEEEGPTKGEGLESGDGGVSKVPGEEDVPPGEGTPRASGKGAGRGRGRGRPPRSLRRSRRPERDSKDTSKLLLLYDDHILDNDPLRESKDIAFAQAYLNRVREALQGVPGKVEEFLGLLYEFEQEGEGRSAVELFSQLRPVLGEWPDLLRDFAAFLLPEQALECGLFEEQQAFERSRRFLRQLEISFGENLSHYQKIVRALQGGPGLSPASIEELKAQMSSLLKGHTHLQGEFWVFFDELRPPSARPGQFEEACWPEEAGGGIDGGEGVGLGSGGGASGGFEEVTLPDLEEEEIPPMTGRSRRRKMGSHGIYKECDWPEKDCFCLCHGASHDAKLRRHKRKGCSRCHGNKASDGIPRAMKSLDPLYPTATSPTANLHIETGGEEREEEREDEKEEREEDKEVDAEVKDEVDSGANSPHPDKQPLCFSEKHRAPSWEGPEEGSLPLTEKEDDEEEWKDGEREHSPSPKRSKGDGEGSGVSDGPPTAFSGEMENPLTPLQPCPSPSSDPPVCAKNISLTASGEKVILWTREADRVILTTCQQQGANQSTFQAISTQLGNKTLNEVSRRFRDLMRLFHTAARQVNLEDDAVTTEQQTVTDEEQD
ncbi:GON-4-like protein isoform X1 [Salvelinus namaycush]|uniref:GON-4-like protein n=1 Tax=Salvelinus namaycush TaxID=8040 RepID=A0A8U0UFJ9_SALNM|nr:GON-4-like protein isoform X1 [Salvelinus namaycush]